MELNRKTIDTTIKALQIAKHVTTLEYSKKELSVHLTGIAENVRFDFLETQAGMIDLIDDFERTLRDFQQLASRQQYQINEE